MTMNQVLSAIPGLSARDIKIKTDALEINLAEGKSVLKVSNRYLVEQVSSLDIDGKVDIQNICYYFIPSLSKH